MYFLPEHAIPGKTAASKCGDIQMLYNTQYKLSITMHWYSQAFSIIEHQLPYSIVIVLVAVSLLMVIGFPSFLFFLQVTHNSPLWAHMGYLEPKASVCFEQQQKWVGMAMHWHGMPYQTNILTLFSTVNKPNNNNNKYSANNYYNLWP